MGYKTKPGASWLFDESNDKLVGVTDPDGGARFFANVRFDSNQKAVAILNPDGTDANFMDPANSSNVLTWWAGSTVASSAPQNVFGALAQSNGYATAHILREMAGHFDEVSIGFGNTSSTYDIHLAGLAACVTDTLADTTLDAVFADTTLAPAITFDGGNTKGIVPKRDVNVTGNGPSIKWSDYVPLKSVDRSDIIGARPLLAVRALFDFDPSRTITGAGAAQSGGASYWQRGGAEWTAGGAAPVFFSAKPWGNFLRTPMTGSHSVPNRPTNDAQIGSQVPIFGIRLKTRNKAITIMFAGDSIVSCDFASNSDRSYGWANYAVGQVSTLDRPVEYCNMAIASQTSSTYTKFAKYAAELIRPTAIAFWGFTPNDATIANNTVALQDQLNLLTANKEIMRKCAKDLNADFMLINGVPRGVSATASYWDATRGLMTEKFKNALLNDGVLSIDTNTAVSNKTSIPYLWQNTALGDAADFNQVDFIHPNQAGRTAMRAPAIAAVTKLRDTALPVSRK